MRRTCCAGIVVFAAALAVGCSPLTSPLDLSGTYSLRTINGAALPFVLPQSGAATVIVWSDAFVLTVGGSYTEHGYRSSTVAGVTIASYPVDAGNVTRRNNSVTLESVLVGLRSATISNGTLTLVEGDLTLVYQK